MRARSSTLYLATCAGALALSLPLGEIAVGVVFLLVGIATTTIIVRSTRRNRPPAPEVWYGFAVGVSLFLIGGIAGELTRDPDAPLSEGFPGLQELFDGIAYLCVILAVRRMGQVRGATRDRTHLLDALIGVGGFGVDYEESGPPFDRQGNLVNPGANPISVSYTHLTLPTILLV